MNGPPAAILFDLDGTLHDRAATLASFLPDQARRFAARLGTVPTADWARLFHALDDCGRVPKEVVYPALLTGLGIDAACAPSLIDDYFAVSPRHAVPVATATSILDSARRRGLKLAIVTNGLSRLQDAVIASLGFEALVDTVLVSEREGLRKPDAALFRRAAWRLGVAVEDCLMVGDDPVADVLGADRAGMATAWLSAGAPWPESLPPCPGRVLPSLAALGAILDGR